MLLVAFIFYSNFFIPIKWKIMEFVCLCIFFGMVVIVYSISTFYKRITYFVDFNPIFQKKFNTIRFKNSLSSNSTSFKWISLTSPKPLIVFVHGELMRILEKSPKTMLCVSDGYTISTSSFITLGMLTLFSYFKTRPIVFCKKIFT
jgi:hypothetical protein